MEPTLTELVVLLSDAPTASDRDAFCRALAAAQVYFPVPKAPPESGPHTVQQGESFALPTAPGPNGGTVLLVYADEPSVLHFHPNAPYAAIAGRVVLQLALANGFGVVVQCVHNGRASWSAVLSNHVAAVLAEAPSQGS